MSRFQKLIEQLNVLDNEDYKREGRICRKGPFLCCQHCYGLMINNMGGLAMENMDYTQYPSQVKGPITITPLSKGGPMYGLFQLREGEEHTVHNHSTPCLSCKKICGSGRLSVHDISEWKICSYCKGSRLILIGTFGIGAWIPALDNIGMFDGQPLPCHRCYGIGKVMEE